MLPGPRVLELMLAGYPCFLLYTACSCLLFVHPPKFGVLFIEFCQMLYRKDISPLAFTWETVINLAAKLVFTCTSEAPFLPPFVGEKGRKDGMATVVRLPSPPLGPG